MNNNELPAETAAEKTTEAEVKTSRHTIGKPHVACSFFVNGMCLAKSMCRSFDC